MPQSRNEYPFLRVRGQEITTLYSLPKNNKYKKELKAPELIYKISAVADPMFHALFNHPGRIKFPARLLSYLLNIPFEVLVKNMKLTTSDVPKEKESSITQRSDLVCELDDTVITVEMNNNATIEYLHRNIDYMFRQYNAKVGNSNEYKKYRQSILINLNNFAFEGIDEVYTVSYLQDENGIVLTDRLIVVNIFIPNLLEKCYTLRVESLNELEKFIYAIVEDDVSKIEDLLKEMPMLEDYVRDAKKVSSEDVLLESYDHERATVEQSYLDGMEQGLKKGKDESKIEMIKYFYKNGANIELISKSAQMNSDEIQDIVKDVKQNFGESYDHERATAEQSYLDGMEQGKEESKIEIIKSFYQNGANIKLISKSANLSIEEVEKILGINN